MSSQTTATTMRVSTATRDALSALAQDEFHGASLDEAVRKLVFDYRARSQFAEMEADEEYQDEAASLDKVDVGIKE